MRSNLSNLVYYVVYLGNARASYDSVVGSHIQSVESVRKSNQSIPICLVVWNGKLRRKDQHVLEQLGVHIHYVGNYENSLKERLAPGWARVLAKYESGPKWLSLPYVLTAEVDRVLYIDNDTLLLGDIEGLFALSQGADMYAREEPLTNLSHFGYDPSYINQSTLDDLLRSEGLNQILPFNTGVVLMRREVAKWLTKKLDVLLLYHIRFTMWLAQNAALTESEPFVNAARKLNLSKVTSGPFPLRYPSSNQWIIDQFAFWFTLAVGKFEICVFPFSSVLQGPEFLAIGDHFPVPYLVHYYSANANRFAQWFSDGGSWLRPTCAAPAK